MRDIGLGKVWIAVMSSANFSSVTWWRTATPAPERTTSPRFIEVDVAVGEIATQRTKPGGHRVSVMPRGPGPKTIVRSSSICRGWREAMSTDTFIGDWENDEEVEEGEWVRGGNDLDSGGVFSELGEGGGVDSATI